MAVRCEVTAVEDTASSEEATASFTILLWQLTVIGIDWQLFALS